MIKGQVGQPLSAVFGQAQAYPLRDLHYQVEEISNSASSHYLRSVSIKSGIENGCPNKYDSRSQLLMQLCLHYELPLRSLCSIFSSDKSLQQHLRIYQRKSRLSTVRLAINLPLLKDSSHYFYFLNYTKT